MTKIEYGKCEKLMNEAIAKVIQAQEEYAESENYLNNENKLEQEIKQRQADQHYGEAIGINQALAVLGFAHDRMKELAKLL